MNEATQARRFSVGAEIVPDGGVEFRVWAPGRKTVEVILEGGPGSSSDDGPPALRLRRDGKGYFAVRVASAGPGTRYRFRLDGEDPSYPDPASRHQPEGPHGPSEVVDPSAFRWTDRRWRGPARQGQVLYEMHVGTFTPEGTWRAAAEPLPALAELGVTVLEIMPVTEFPGRFNWGYDGVAPFSPSRNYGTPDDMRHFVDRAHATGLAVILDVCFSHLGPDGNYLGKFSPRYFTDRYENDWGRPFNFDGEGSGPVREYVLGSVAYWVEEFHVDGLRIDATQDTHDQTPGEHILEAIARRVREAAEGRRTLVIGENEAQQAHLIRPAEQGGYGLDALWADDFHHVAIVAATGRREAYYRDYLGTPQEFVSVAKRGFLYQGQINTRQGKRRGSPTFGLEPWRFVQYLQNHDQLANSLRGERFHRLTDPGLYRALTAALLLGPGTPLLFQGQEFAASGPFLYFGDQKREIADSMHRGRQDQLSQFASLAVAETKRLIPRPDAEAFARSKLDHAERARHAEAYALHRDLLRLRREDPVFRLQRPGGVDGAVLGPGAFVLRYFGDEGDDRLLVINLGPDLHLDPAPEPLLAPPSGALWDPIWSSEDPRYGGGGTPPLESDADNWRIPGHAAVALAPRIEDATTHG
jgi:maltooligosyltrehalose trehalohydrolase